MQVENHETEKPQKNICVIVNIYFYAGPEIPQVEILYWQGQRTGKHAIRMKHVQRLLQYVQPTSLLHCIA